MNMKEKFHYKVLVKLNLICLILLNTLLFYQFIVPLSYNTYLILKWVIKESVEIGWIHLKDLH